MFPILFSALVIILGLMIGSFLNVCIYRIPLGRTVVKGRSYCTSCGNLIPWYCNIPVLSYLFLLGRCKNCREPISPIYPAVELLNALLTYSAFLHFGYTLSAVFASAFFSALIVVSFIDLKHQIIPDGLVIFTLILGVLNAAWHTVGLSEPWYTFVIGVAAASLPLFLLGMVFPDGLGGGDVKLMAAAGLFMGWKLILMALFFGNFLALFYVIVRMLRGKFERGNPIPYGPFLSAGMIVCLLAGDRLIEIYLKSLSLF
ncbi:MAG TPA: prepilin peptidase [Anaerovoracaceae bacterium]|nr:prepilin peptidase [Anaerovoracaceae bacterium]